MKHLNRFLSVVLAAAMLVPGTMPKAAAHSQEPDTQNMHPFYGTEQLIRDAVTELRDQGKIMEGAAINAALIASVEENSEKTYNEVKTAVVTRMMANLASGEINVSDLNLTKDIFEKVMEEVLRDNYLYRAITGMTYSTKNGKVAAISFDASEGYKSAMNAFDEENAADKLKAELEDLMDRLPELYYDMASRIPVMYGARTMALAAEPACARHTVNPGKLLGDTNGDMVLNVKDLVGIRALMAEGKTSDVADVNKDQAVDAKDLDALRHMIVDQVQPELVSGPDIQFKWALQQDFTPRDAQGNPVDMSNPANQSKIANGGLLYAPNRETGEMEIQQGILPDVYWGLEEVSFTCAECGEKVTYTRNAADPADPMNQVLDQMVTRMNVYMDTTTFNPQTGEGMVQVPVTEEQPETSDTFILATEISVAGYADDTYQTDEEGNPVAGFYVDTNKDANGQSHNDNMTAKIDFFYNMFSAFNADNADYLGVSGRYWTTKNSDADPLAAIKSLCNIPLDQQIPPANLVQLIQMLPQAFMSYVYYYGDQLLDMKAAARELVKSLPAKATRVQKMLVLHDWVAENTTFDMGVMMSVNESAGNPETDPIQMTAFGSLLSRQLAAQPVKEGQKPYGGCICLGYVAAYNLLLQDIIYPDVYKDAEGWKTADEVGTKDCCDFGQVMFYSNTSNTSIAGEGFGGGFFNNVHYYNLVRVPEAPQTGGDKDNPRDGDWFFVDVCYDDIFVECMSQYRAEADGSVHHDYFLVSPLTMNKIWGNAVDFISNLHDGVEFKTKVDENGKPVPYPSDDEQHYDPKNPGHPMHVTVPADNEVGSNNTCYQDTWFSGAVSKVYNDGENWYYVDSENSTLGFADKAEEDDDGNYKFNFEDMAKHDVKTGIHATRASQSKQAKMKSRPMAAVDYWEGEKEDSGLGGIMGGQKPKEYKKDPHANVLLDYGTGKGKYMADDLKMMEAVKEHYTYTDQYPGLTLCLGLHDGKLYFNLGARIYAYDLAANKCDIAKTYTDVKASTDGRTFTASSFKLDPEGTALAVKDNPIAGLVIRTAYIPQYQPVMGEDGQPVMGPDGQPRYEYTKMQQQEVMTVNIGTNYSFTADFDANADMDENMKTVYTQQAYNYNGDYNQVLENNLAEAKKSKNNNKEFLWCANILDEFPVDGFEAEAEAAAKAVPCTASEHGHEYVYNADEEMFICKNCLLHAKNYTEENEFFELTLHHKPSSGQGGGGGLGDLIGGGDKGDDTIVPVNDSREAALVEGATMKDDKPQGGKILVEVTPKAVNVDKEVVAIQYRDTKGSEPVLVTEKDENGMFILQKPVKGDTSNGCMIISAVLGDAFRVNTHFEGGSGSAKVEPAVPVAGEPVTVTITPNPGIGVKEVHVMAGETELTDVDWNAENNQVVFKMPESSVDVNITLETVYKIKIDDESTNLVHASKKQAAEGTRVQLLPAPGYKLQSLTVVNDSTSERISLDKDNYFTMPASNVTVSAKVAPVQPETRHLTVVGGIIVTDDETTPAEGQFAPESNVTVSAVVPEKKAFVKWTSEDMELNEKVAVKPQMTFKMPNADVTLTATFKDLFTVTFDANGGEVSPESVLTNAEYKLTKLPEPTREGYTFDGWFTAAEGGDAVTVDRVYTADTTVYAHWTINQYTVTYTDGVEGKEIFKDQTATVDYGTKTPKFEGTTDREGYVFQGWDPAVEKTVTKNVTYTAQWKQIPEATVTFKVVNGTWDGTDAADKTVTVKLDQENLTKGTLNQTDIPTGMQPAEGYKAGAWDKEISTTVTGDVTYTYTFVEIDPEPVVGYLITLNYNDGTPPKDAPASVRTNAEGKLVEELPVPTRDGYVFKGWSTTPPVATSTFVPAGGATFTQDSTIYAWWEAPEAKN